MDFQNELVLSLVQPLLKDRKDHVNSKMVTKFLLKSGNEDPNRPMPPLGWSLSHSRKKTDTKRLQLHSTKHNLKGVYLESELPALHSLITSLPAFDILGVNLSTEYLDGNSFSCKVFRGWYLPVMYKRQKQPFFSMIFKNENHTQEEETQFLENLQDLGIHAVYHHGVADIMYELAEMQMKDPKPSSDDRIRLTFWDEAKELLENPRRPFRYWVCTTTKRWNDIHSSKTRIITIG